MQCTLLIVSGAAILGFFFAVVLSNPYLIYVKFKRSQF